MFPGVRLVLSCVPFARYPFSLSGVASIRRRLWLLSRTRIDHHLAPRHHMIPSAGDLERRTLTVAAEFRDQNPRRPRTHGWLAFEVLRRAPGGSLRFEEYASHLFNPDQDIRALANTIPGQPNAFQQYKHIRCDIFRGTVRVDPPLPEEWYRVERCSSGTQPYPGSSL